MMNETFVFPQIYHLRNENFVFHKYNIETFVNQFQSSFKEIDKNLFKFMLL